MPPSDGPVSNLNDGQERKAKEPGFSIASVKTEAGRKKAPSSTTSTSPWHEYRIDHSGNRFSAVYYSRGREGIDCRVVIGGT
jgi:hypothetical protein